jgi:DNA-binding NarL/FixJ family response regulator
MAAGAPARGGHDVTPITVVLVDDHRVVTRSLQAWLESFPDIRVVGVAANGEEALERIDGWRPDVVLQDLLMPGGLDGIDTTRRLIERAPGVKVIALTASLDEARMMGVLRAGAVGYVRKDAEPETLLAAVRAVARGRTFIDPAIGAQLVRAAVPGNDLTRRELEVLRRLVLGKSNRDIAGELAVGEETVKTHVAHVLAKLNVENRAQAIVEALRRGLMTLEDLEAV